MKLWWTCFCQSIGILIIDIVRVFLSIATIGYTVVLLPFCKTRKGKERLFNQYVDNRIELEW